MKAIMLLVVVVFAFNYFAKAGDSLMFLNVEEPEHALNVRSYLGKLISILDHERITPQNEKKIKEIIQEVQVLSRIEAPYNDKNKET